MRVFPLAVVALLACGRSDLLEIDDTPSGGSDSSAGASDASTSNADDGSPLFTTEASTSTDGGVPPRVCDSKTCPAGCCAKDGRCITTPSPDTCGFFGEACTVCPPGDYCKGACVSPATNCGPSNCAGCCAGPSYCADGAHGTACGHGGEECARCGAPEGTGTCEPAPGGGGTCVKASTCGPSNCTGCCYGTVCAVGTQDIACGSGGEACHACNGLSCVAGTCR